MKYRLVEFSESLHMGYAGPAVLAQFRVFFMSERIVGIHTQYSNYPWISFCGRTFSDDEQIHKKARALLRRSEFRLVDRNCLEDYHRLNNAPFQYEPEFPEADYETKKEVNYQTTKRVG